MANTVKITNLQALSILATIPEDVLSDYLPDEIEFTATDLHDKTKKMRDSEQKRADNRKNAPKTPSKETLANEERARKVAKLIAEHGDVVTLDWIIEHVDDVYTISGASGCMRTANRLGLVTNGEKVKINNKWRTTYTATNAAMALLDSDE